MTTTASQSTLIGFGGLRSINTPPRPRTSPAQTPPGGCHAPTDMVSRGVAVHGFPLSYETHICHTRVGGAEVAR